MERFFFFVFRFLGPFPFLHLSLPLPALGPRSLLVRLFPVHNRPLFPLLFAPFALPCFHIPSFLLCDTYFILSTLSSHLFSPPIRDLSPFSTSIPPWARPLLVYQIAGPSTCQSFIASNHSAILASLATAGTLSSAHATSQLPFVLALDR